MLGRISQTFIKDQFLYSGQRRESQLNAVQNQLSSGQRIQLASEDPLAATRYMRYDSRIHENRSYIESNDKLQNKLAFADSKLSGVNDALQRIRELTVQAANGVYGADDRRNMAVEVDELLRFMLDQANADYKGDTLFAGTSGTPRPFSYDSEVDPDLGTEAVRNVRYLGNAQAQLQNVNRDTNIAGIGSGAELFWARNMAIRAQTDVNAYIAPQTGRIVVDGKEIVIQQGDNIEAIAQKINDSGAAVEANLLNQNGQSFFQLETQIPHQITLQQMDGSTVLSDMGLIDAGLIAPNNTHPNAITRSGSIFDVAMELRDSLLANDVQAIGGEHLGDLDMALAGIAHSRARMGAIGNRLSALNNGLAQDQILLTDVSKHTIGTDVSQSIMELKMLELAHNVALNVGARLMPRTLLDFLR